MSEFLKGLKNNFHCLQTWRSGATTNVFVLFRYVLKAFTGYLLNRINNDRNEFEFHVLSLCKLGNLEQKISK